MKAHVYNSKPRTVKVSRFDYTRGRKQRGFFVHSEMGNMSSKLQPPVLQDKGL